MKRILITGAESYIGTSFEKWLEKPQFVDVYKRQELIRELMEPEFGPMFVTPQDIDERRCV